jgi:hypothetical protein
MGHTGEGARDATTTASVHARTHGLDPLSAGYWFMIAALLSFAGMGIAHKLGESLRCQAMGIALVTMLTGCAVSLLRTVVGRGPALSAVPAHVALLAVPFGVSAALAIFLFQKGLRYGRIVTSWLLINLSSAVPTLLERAPAYHARPDRHIAVAAVVGSRTNR